jgi:hypothetical protein
MLLGYGVVDHEEVRVASIRTDVIINSSGTMSFNPHFPLK